MRKLIIWNGKIFLVLIFKHYRKRTQDEEGLIIVIGHSKHYSSAYKIDGKRILY